MQQEEGIRAVVSRVSISPIVQDRQAVRSFSSKLEILVEVACDHFNGIRRFHGSPRDIPYNRQKPTGLSRVSREKHSVGDLARVNVDQVWIPHRDHCLVGDQRDPGTAGEDKSPLMSSFKAAASPNEQATESPDSCTL